MKNKSDWPKRFREALDTPCIRDSITEFRNKRNLAKAFPNRYKFMLQELNGDVSLCLYEGTWPWGKTLLIVSRNCYFEHLIEKGNLYCKSILS